MRTAYLTWKPQETVIINGVPLKNPSRRHKVKLLIPLEGMEIVRQVRKRTIDNRLQTGLDYEP